MKNMVETNQVLVCDETTTTSSFERPLSVREKCLLFGHVFCRLSKRDRPSVQLMKDFFTNYKTQHEWFMMDGVGEDEDREEDGEDEGGRRGAHANKKRNIKVDLSNHPPWCGIMSLSDAIRKALDDLMTLHKKWKTCGAMFGEHVLKQATQVRNKLPQFSLFMSLKQRQHNFTEHLR